jgi:hypothetical protein
MSETRRLCGVPSERGFLFRVDSQGWHPGLVCDAHSGHGNGIEINVEVGRNRTGLNNRSEKRSAPRPGSATHGYKRSDGPGGNAATVAGYAGPSFHNWPPGHIPQHNGSESAFTQPVHDSKIVRRGVRRRDRGQRPTATEDPDTKDPNTKQRHSVVASDRQSLIWLHTNRAVRA